MAAAVVLRCAHCGGELAGRDADVVWTCSPCGKAFEACADGLAERRFVALAPRAGGALVWLPFWRVAFEPQVDGEGAQALQELRRAASPGRAWVRAFWLDGAFNLGDPGQALTAQAFDETCLDGPPPPAPGSVVPLADAWRLAELFILAAADRRADVTPVRLVLEKRDACLVAVPFADLGTEVRCPVTGRTYRKSVLAIV